LAGGLNLYGYADGDPINKSDPFGLCPPCGGLAAFENAVKTEIINPLRSSRATPAVSTTVTVAGVTAQQNVLGGPTTYTASTNPGESGFGMSLTWDSGLNVPLLRDGQALNIGAGRHLGISIADGELSLNVGFNTPNALNISVSQQLRNTPAPQSRAIPAVLPDNTAVSTSRRP
jgi:hypothetical protein